MTTVQLNHHHDLHVYYSDVANYVHVDSIWRLLLLLFSNKVANLFILKTVLQMRSTIKTRLTEIDIMTYDASVDKQTDRQTTDYHEISHIDQ